MLRATGIAVLLAAATARADSNATLTIQLNDRGRELASDFGFNEQELLDRLRAQVDDVYQTAHLDKLLRSFADTAAFADRSFGVDYQPHPGDRTVGVIGNAAISNDVSLGDTTHLFGGVIANGGLVVGADLARWHLPRWSVFVNASYIPTKIHGLDGHLLTTGAHAQARVLDGTRPGSAQWTGLSVVTGLEVARWSLGTDAGPIPSHFTVLGSQPDEKKTVHIDAMGRLSVLSTSVTVPVEVATGVRFFGRIGIYAAGGLDFTTGSSTITADLDGDLTINQMESIGTATIVASGSHGPSPVSAHALAGIQLHTSHVRVFLQGAQATSDKGVVLGARGAF